MKPKILLVDDDEPFLQTTQETLIEKDYECLICADSNKALAAINTFTPDCVILDIRMPSLDGQDLLLMIRRKYPHLPVIICTGLGNVDEHYMLKSGATEILTKPFTCSMLFDTLDRAMKQNNEVTPIVLQGFKLREIQNLVLRKIIIRALTQTNFNHTHTADLLGISRQCLLRYLRRLEITC